MISSSSLIQHYSILYNIYDWNQLISKNKRVFSNFLDRFNVLLVKSQLAFFFGKSLDGINYLWDFTQFFFRLCGFIFRWVIFECICKEMSLTLWIGVLTWKFGIWVYEGVKKGEKHCRNGTSSQSIWNSN